jgi:hypothetical protein
VYFLSFPPPFLPPLFSLPFPFSPFSPFLL